MVNILSASLHQESETKKGYSGGGIGRRSKTTWYIRLFISGRKRPMFST